MTGSYKRPWGLGTPIEKLEPYAMAAFAKRGVPLEAIHAGESHGGKRPGAGRPKGNVAADDIQTVHGPHESASEAREPSTDRTRTTRTIARLKRERDRGDEQATELLTKVEAGELTPLMLDGRSRLRACYEACVRPEFKEYVGDDPVGFVVSLNLTRQHLSESQRANVAARIATLTDGQRQVGKFADVPTQAEAAKLLNVSERQVRSARAVQRTALPEIVEAVDRGEVSLGAAAEVARLPVDEQRVIAAEGPKAVKAKAAEIREEPHASD